MGTPQSLNSRINPRFMRLGLIVAGLVTIALGLLALSRYSSGCSWCFSSVDDVTTHQKDATEVKNVWGVGPDIPPSCSKSQNDHKNPLTALVSKYAHLRDDKFTIAMQTYKRPDELANTLKALTDEKIPSLHEIVVVWNNLEEEPPVDYQSKHGVPVRYRKSAENNLHQKLIPDPKYETKAILLTDDDVYYEPQDLEFVFQSWRNFGQFRLVGALPRCSDRNKEGRLEYGFCSSDEDKRHYSMILTNLCFSHIAFLDYYSSDAPEAKQIRDWVNDKFNCEDIALNFLASSLTGFGPLEANGYKNYHNADPKAGISRKPGHFEARTECLNKFSEILGCMPLVDETFHIVRGMTVL